MLSCVVNSRPHTRRTLRSPRCDTNLPFRPSFRPLFPCAAHSSKFRILFQVAYTLSPLLATLTKTAGVYDQQFPFWNSSPCRSLILHFTCLREPRFAAHLFLCSTCNAPVDHHHYLKSFSCSTYRPRRMFCKQKTYGIVKLFRCNTYKKQGEGSHYG